MMEIISSEIYHLSLYLMDMAGWVRLKIHRNFIANGIHDSNRKDLRQFVSKICTLLYTNLTSIALPSCYPKPLVILFLPTLVKMLWMLYLLRLSMTVLKLFMRPRCGRAKLRALPCARCSLFPSTTRSMCMVCINRIRGNLYRQTLLLQRWE
jgi:hypothetical protein